jgi:protein ImuB
MLRPVSGDFVFEQTLELEYPVTELEPLSFVLSRLLREVFASLESRALAAIGIQLRLKLENQTEHARALRLPVPMRDTMTLLKLLQLELAAHPPAAPILAVSLHAEAAKPAPRRADCTRRPVRSRRSWS